MIYSRPYKRGRIWWGKFRLDPTDPITYFSTGCTDKQSAQRIIDQRVREAQQERAGLILPKAQREASNVPLVDHLPDFLEAQDRDSFYLKNREGQLSRLFKECGWKFPRDASNVSFEAWRVIQRGRVEPKTLNEYLCAASMFFKWMVKAGRMAHNPLASVGRESMKGRDKTRKRRCFSEEELRKLVRLSGSHGIVYLLVAYTGLRRGEINQLRWKDVFLEAEAPYIQTRASTTKNGKEAVLHLGAELAAALKEHRPKNWEPEQKVFPRKAPDMDLMRKHLERAGIPYVDERGGVADFHALRHTFITRLAQRIKEPVVLKEAARHSDFKQTMAYIDKAKLPVAEALKSLPGLGLSQGVSQKIVKRLPGESSDVQNTEKPAASQSLENQGIVPLCPINSGNFLEKGMAHPSGFEPETF